MHHFQNLFQTLTYLLETHKISASMEMDSDPDLWFCFTQQTGEKLEPWQINCNKRISIKYLERLIASSKSS